MEEICDRLDECLREIFGSRDPSNELPEDASLETVPPNQRPRFVPIGFDVAFEIRFDDDNSLLLDIESVNELMISLGRLR